jgi:hypothetical protein
MARAAVWPAGDPGAWADDSQFVAPVRAVRAFAVLGEPATWRSHRFACCILRLS